MSGPRVSSGTDSKQDYATPAEFIAAVEASFGESIAFDLAAHAGNKKHARYFAPSAFVTTGTYDSLGLSPTYRPTVLETFTFLKKDKKTGLDIYERRVVNADPEAEGFDSFDQDWAAALAGGLGWLNCEFNDCGAWAKKCSGEAMRGARVLLLTPASVGSNWFRDHIAGIASVYLLNGRLSFDGVGLFPKDCMLSLFGPTVEPRIAIWNWRTDEMPMSWAPTMDYRAARVA